MLDTTTAHGGLLAQVTAAVDAAATVSEVWSALRPGLEAIGAEVAVCGAHDPSGRMVAQRQDYPEALRRELTALDLAREDFTLAHMNASAEVLVRALPRDPAAALPAEAVLARHGLRWLMAVRVRRDATGQLNLIAFAGQAFAPDRRRAALTFRLLAGLLASRYDPREDPAAALHHQPERLRPLSPRERGALALLVRGERLEGIAATMGITEATARKHVASARRKLGARTRDQAVALAVRLGLLPV